MARETSKAATGRTCLNRRYPKARTGMITATEVSVKAENAYDLYHLTRFEERLHTYLEISGENVQPYVVESYTG